MKGIILAGGLGTRLRPLTLVTNKHLLPVYDRPMIYYPIQCLVNAGIEEVLVVTGGEHAGDFLKLLKNGKHLGVRHLEYAYQEGEGGIADALKLAEEFADGGKVCVVLGDNIIEGSIRKAAADFYTQKSGAKIILKEVPDPQRFGVAAFDGDGPRARITRIIEKPKDPPSTMAVTGIYFYDADAFRVCKDLKPSGRGELEITDVNNYYLNRGDLTHETLEGWWTDAGTFESLLRAARLVADGGANHLDLGLARPPLFSAAR
ncbi:MAG: NTP transferase domain-containing protein [Phycisphaerae bacterium]|nr:NTP transferase domain-containing protein [Phycisphaerae bacterium]